MTPPTDIPKYLKGILITSQFRIVAKCRISVCSTPILPRLLLEKFTLRPNVNSKPFNITFILNTLLIFALQKNKVSPIYWNIFTFTDLFPISKVSIKSFSNAVLDTPANPSAAIRKKNGTNRSPCLNPFFEINSLLELPFTRIIYV